MTRRVFMVVPTLSALILACDGNQQSGLESGTEQDCSDGSGGRLDVANEPDGRRYAEYLQWTDRDGCLLRIDVLAERNGPDHCGWATARVLIAGDPIGTRYTSGADTVEYVSDPSGVFGVAQLSEGFQLLDQLPDDAQDSGFRQGSRELWTSSSDLHVVYIRTPDGVERWPSGVTPKCF
jgi:hypothetical protein